MSEIYAKLIHFNAGTNLSKLVAAGYVINRATDKYERRPDAGYLYLQGTPYNYISEKMEIVHDLYIYMDGSGYYLELPAGCKPAPADPSRTAQPMSESKLRQAVRWLYSAPGRTQQQAADMFGVAQGNISVTAKRMRRKGEI